MLDYSLKITNFGWLSESDAQVSSLDIFKFAHQSINQLTNYFNTSMLFYLEIQTIYVLIEHKTHQKTGLAKFTARFFVGIKIN